MKERLKRLVDLAVVMAAAPVALPLMLVTAVAIRRETPGPAIFRQTRVGKNGRPFVLYKLRTMVDNAEHIGAGLYAEKEDPRFTRVGTFARRWSLDELPQLLNVAKGDMSVVGPRPMLPVTVDEYREDYDRILQVKPGLTGLVQVSGRNALTRPERIALDVKYAGAWSNLGDFSILLRTVRVVATGDGQLNHGERHEVEGT